MTLNERGDVETIPDIKQDPLRTAMAKVAIVTKRCGAYGSCHPARRRGCRSFHCPRRAEVAATHDEAVAGSTRDSFWCLGHWPLLRDMFRVRGRKIADGPGAPSLAGEVDAKSGAFHGC
jgi:hypothetical protein